MVSVLPGENIMQRLKDFNADEASPTCCRIHRAYLLMSDLNSTPDIPIAEVGFLGQRVSLPLVELPCKDGCLKGFNKDTGLVEVVLDSGELLHSQPMDVIALMTVQDTRLDYVSRIVWSSVISESRLPLSGEQIKADLSPWDMFEPAFFLSSPWTRAIWTAHPQTTIADFQSWLYLFAESIRMRAMDSILFAMRIVEECVKHLDALEAADRASGCRSADVLGFVAEVGTFVRYCPEAVQCVGKTQADGANGAFALLRFMLSSHAIRVLRVLHRTPLQKDLGGQDFVVEKDMVTARLRYFIVMQMAAEKHIRESGCASLFGDGQSDWNDAWLCEVLSDAAGVCTHARRAIALVEAGGDSNDFVAGKARWDLAGYMTLGGEGSTFDLRVIRNLCTEAKTYSDRLAAVGMEIFVAGESTCSVMVQDIVAKYNGKTQHIVQARQLAGSAATKPVRAAKTTLSAAPTCAGCKKNSSDLKMCSRCKKVLYCSRDCQTVHFKIHKKECTT